MPLTKKYLIKLFFIFMTFIPGELLAEEWIIRTSPTEYHPSRLKVKPYDIITWINDDQVVHEMKFTGNPTKSREENMYIFLPIRKKVSIEVSNPGTYPFKCSYHGMFGVIEVQPDGQ